MIFCTTNALTKHAIHWIFADTVPDKMGEVRIVDTGETHVHVWCERIVCCYLRNRFLLTVICCPIYYWLEVSREVDISQAGSPSDIFTDN